MAIPKKGTKRPASASVGARKKSKTSGGCKLVSKALAGNPMLASVVNKTLGVYADERHEFQSKFVDMIGDSLTEMRGTLDEAVATAKTVVDGAQAEKDAREQALANAEADVKAKEEALQAMETTLAASTDTLDSCKATLTEAEQTKKRGEKEQADAEKTKAEVEDTQDKMSRMSDAPGAPADIKAVKKVMDSLSCDQKLLEFLPETLKKAPSDRGQFDAIIMEDMRKTFAEKLKEVTEYLASAAAETAARETAVTDATEAHKSASEKKDADTATKDGAVAALKEAKSALKQAKAAIASYESDMKSAAKGLSAAEGKLANFCNGALSSFTELKDMVRPPPEPAKVTPPPEPEPAVPEEPSQPASSGGVDVI